MKFSLVSLAEMTEGLTIGGYNHALHELLRGVTVVVENGGNQRWGQLFQARKSRCWGRGK